MSVLSYTFYFLLLKLSNKGINFSLPLLKLLNKKIEEYSKIIIFIHFHTIPFSLKPRLNKILKKKKKKKKNLNKMWKNSL